MELELEQRLRNNSKETLIQVLQELVIRHPVLRTEIATILHQIALPTGGEDEGEELSEDWDFSRHERVKLHTFTRPTLLPLDSAGYRQNVVAFEARLRQGEQPGVITDEIMQLFREAEYRFQEQDYSAALELYALAIDERLAERLPLLTELLDEAIQAQMPAIDELLVEASGNTRFDTMTITLSPLLTTSVRQQWLERLFMLWLKRLDVHTTEEDLPEIMLDVAWSEDLPLLRTLAQNELQKQPQTEYTNIVNLTFQYRTRALEKFLKEIP